MLRPDLALWGRETRSHARPAQAEQTPRPEPDPTAELLVYLDRWEADPRHDPASPARAPAPRGR